MNKAIALATVSGLALSGMVLAAPAAEAKNDQIRMRGACASSSTATWAVKVKNKKGGLRTDFWVKTDAAGQGWKFTLARGTQLLATSTRSTTASDDQGSDDQGSDDSRRSSRVALRDRGGDDDGLSHDADDDRVTGIDDSIDDDSDDDSVTGVLDSTDESDDDGPDHDADDDRVTGIDDSTSAASSSSARSSSHVAEAKWRTWIDNNGGGDLVFTATFNGQTCTVTI